MDAKIKYENWPTLIKVGTAFSTDKLLIKNYKIPKYLGYLLIVIGVLSIDYSIFSGEVALGYEELFKSLCYFFIGGMNLVTAYYIKWIEDNSSWEERFANNSSTTHKIVYMLVTVLLLVALIVVLKHSIFFR